MTTDDTTTVPVLLPELDGELAHELTALEEWAIELQITTEDEADLGIDAAAARAALAELWTVAAAAACQQPGRLLAPEGRHEHQPMRTAHVPRTHLATLDATLAACRAAQNGGGNPALQEALEPAAERHAAALSPGTEGPDPLQRMAAMLQVLTLPGVDVETLRTALEAGAADGDTVLCPEADEARARVADRITRAWYGADPLQRWGMG